MAESQVESSPWAGFFLTTLCLVCGIAMWYFFLRGNTDYELNYKKFTKEKLRGLLDELELAYCSVFVRNYA